jgi:hypothetical protein
MVQGMALPYDAAELAQRDPVASLFEVALGLARPWQIEKIEFDPEGRRLDLHLGFPRGSRFACSECAREGCPVHDTATKGWRHLNFFGPIQGNQADLPLTGHQDGLVRSRCHRLPPRGQRCAAQPNDRSCEI